MTERMKLHLAHSLWTIFSLLLPVVLSWTPPLSITTKATTNSPRDLLDRQHGGILYKTSVLDADQMTVILDEVKSLLLTDETAHSVAQHRRGAVVPADSATVQILAGGRLLDWIRRLTTPDYDLVATHIPVELRTYEQVGAGMAWHVDDVLYRNPPQVEVVVTLENTSDCRTLWKRANVVESVETEPNSAIILRAGGPEHCVTSLKRGRRVIIKCVYASKHAELVADTSDVAQFQSNQAGKKKKRKRR